MLLNYLKIAVRNLSRHKLFSFINIFGLALSMSVCMMVMVRLQEEFRFDKFHPKAARTYRIISTVTNKEGGQFRMASTPLPLENAISSESGFIEASAQIYPALNSKAAYEGKSIAIRGAFTGPSFFDVFGFRLSSGNKQLALRLPNSIVLSEETAIKFFGTTNALGKVLVLDQAGSFQVTGVLKSQGRSHLEFDAYASIATVPQLEKNRLLPAKMNNWDSFEQGYTYVVLNEKASVSQLNNILPRIVSVINKETASGSFAFSAQALNDITPSSMNLMNETGSGSDWSKIWTEIGVALLILVAACFNYTNLTIARALTRAKEVGIRKVAGAKRSQVFAQYVVESVVIALFALAAAHVLLQLILTYKPFNDGYKMVPEVSLDIYSFLLFLGFALVTGALAGAAPAWILSAFKPVTVLKNIGTQKLFGNISLRKTLIVFQFSLSLVVIIFLSAFYRQFTYMSDADHGFRKDNIVTVTLNGQDPAIFKAAAQQVPGVEHITALSENFGRRISGKMSAATNKKTDQPVHFNYYFTDASVVPAMELKLLAGSNFPASGGDEKYVLINATAVTALGFKNNAEAVDQLIWLNDSTQLQIKGVVHDFYYEGAGRQILPLALRNREGSYTHLNISVQHTDRSKVTEALAAAWKKSYPGKAFNYSWLDKEIREMNAQTASISLLGFLAFMTIAIASLGLLGLVIYTVETRRKEISIRKVIGADVRQLMMMLSRSFIKLLLIAGLIALPVGYVMSVFFLQNFANRVQMGIGWLMLCFLFLLLIGMITILSQTYRASAANPVRNLRSE